MITLQEHKKGLTRNKQVLQWVDEMAKFCKPDRVYWCDGSQGEHQQLIQLATELGEIEALNQEKLPGCYLHRSDKNDVARTEDLTFICTRNKEDAGPTNNWMDPQEAYQKLGEIFEGSMKGR